MQHFDEITFKQKVDAALRRIRTILDNTRNPQLAADVSHQYEDKYRLVEFMGRVTVAALAQCLTSMGLSPQELARLREWAKTRSVTLCFKTHESCAFVREEVKKVESATEQVTEWRGFLGNKSTRTDKVVTTITEYFWSFEFGYELVAFQGTAVDEPVTILSRRGKIELKTPAKTTPRPVSVVRPTRDVDVSWLLRRLDADGRATFEIDRTKASCHTPRRNAEVDAALRSLVELHSWCVSVSGYFLDELFDAQPEHGLDLSAINDEEVFNPVVPLFEASPQGEGGLLPASFANDLIAEQQRTIAARCAALAKVFPRDASVITVVEASFLVILAHAARICDACTSGVAYVEHMLRKQLVAAIGKELSPADFTSYMEFHGRKLFSPEYRPLPFSHAIRRAEHDPEGVLSIESSRGSSMADPISTIVAHSEATGPMYFSLDASTRVAFMGDRHLHAWVSHQFSGASALALNLVARARQFSSFVLLVGRIAAADVFEPRFGIIVQNKDLLKIPLMLEQIPTPKEFRDAIESLSPEQQRFAKAFRGMQLESTLFGVCVIHIKPQLEKLLKLDPDSLTKEIKLTQDLSSLFIDYQIPSDLLSFDGHPGSSSQTKLDTVRSYVSRMFEMIDQSKRREIDEAREREELRLAESNRTPHPPPAFGPPPMPAMPSMPMMAPMPSAAPMAPKSAPSRERSAAPMAAPRSVAAPVVVPSAPAPSAPPPRSPSKGAEQPHTAAATPATTPSTTAASAHEGSVGDSSGGPMDYTRIPAELDKKFEKLDEDGALRPTIINPGDVWTRTAQKGLLSAPATTSLYAEQHKSEKSRAFDLLDALTKSGDLAIDHASLHVVMAATHCFDKALVDTVIEANVNPIEKVERSLVIVATTIHRRSARELLMPEQRERFLALSPKLDEGDAGKTLEPGDER